MFSRKNTLYPTLVSYVVQRVKLYKWADCWQFDPQNNRLRVTKCSCARYKFPWDVQPAVCIYVYIRQQWSMAVEVPLNQWHIWCVFKSCSSFVLLSQKMTKWLWKPHTTSCCGVTSGCFSSEVGPVLTFVWYVSFTSQKTTKMDGTG